MKTTDSQTLPAPPRLITTLVAGFDTITNHIALILFPIGLDLFIWLTPHLRLKWLIDVLVSDAVFQSMSVAPDAETAAILQSARELWSLIAERFNLLAALRSYPVGIPSLMASILPMETPIGNPSLIDVTSFGNALLLFLVLTIAGLIMGTLYFSMVAQAALSGQGYWRRSLAEWLWASSQVILLALVWVILFVSVSIPASCAISITAVAGISVGQCGILLYGGFLLWMIFLLLFSSHGIFVNRYKVWPSVKQGIRITNMTLPTTSLFFVSVLVLTQGLDLLWRIPSEDSWLMLVGLMGHAFVTTGLLAASFIYYRDAGQWVQSLKNQSEQHDET
ncbi:MAG: hypothetical protein KKD28_15750 [Chloroflexi bacterium]|nr:hypothetical protein [Chloroflexota bacterium]